MLSGKEIMKYVQGTDTVSEEKPISPNEAKQIARAHLTEIPDYYTRLAVMEHEAERVKSTQQKEGV